MKHGNANFYTKFWGRYLQVILGLLISQTPFVIQLILTTPKELIFSIKNGLIIVAGILIIMQFILIFYIIRLVRAAMYGYIFLLVILSSMLIIYMVLSSSAKSVVGLWFILLYFIPNILFIYYFHQSRKIV